MSKIVFKGSILGSKRGLGVRVSVDSLLLGDEEEMQAFASAIEKFIEEKLKVKDFYITEFRKTPEEAIGSEVEYDKANMLLSGLSRAGRLSFASVFASKILQIHLTDDQCRKLAHCHTLDYETVRFIFKEAPCS